MLSERRVLPYFMLFPIAICLASCNKKSETGHEEPSRVKEVLACDSLPDEVKTFVKSIDEDDSVAFAGLMAYPVSRPYPLHDIEDEHQMRQYYRHMVDDSLKKIIRTSGPEHWGEYGWKGWTVRGGEYVWIDGQVYDIGYVSVRERAEMDSLGKMEIATLHPTMQGDWTPVGCLVSSDNKKIYRIDARCGKHKGHNKKDSLRLSVYDRKIHRAAVPEEVMTGYEDSEGSASIAIYYFTGINGEKAYYSTNVTDDSGPAIYYTDRKGTERRVDVNYGYWLDILSDEEKGAIEASGIIDTTSNGAFHAASAASDSLKTENPVRKPVSETEPDTIGEAILPKNNQ